MLCVPHRVDHRIAFIYLIQSGDDKGTQIYKIGRSVQKTEDCRQVKRILDYPNGTIIEMVIRVRTDIVVTVEDSIKEAFKKKYRLVRGTEWFEGNVRMMVKNIYDIVNEQEDQYIHSLGKCGTIVKISEPACTSIQQLVSLEGSRGPQVVRGFGCENREYITNEFIYKQVRNMFGIGVTKYLEMVHLHPDHPENRNVWVCPSDPRYYFIVQDGRVQKLKDTIVMQMLFDEAQQHLGYHILNNKGAFEDAHEVLSSLTRVFSAVNKNDRVYRSNRLELHESFMNVSKGVFPEQFRSSA